MALFYDSREYEENFMRMMAVRLMDIFTDTNRKNFEKGELKLGQRAKIAFEKALPLILEHVSDSKLISADGH
jgi:hypothetical protein